MRNLNTVKAIMSIIRGSPGRLIPRPNPISSMLTESGIRKHNTNNKTSSLNSIRKLNSNKKGNRLTQGKSKGIARVLIAINAKLIP
jgi:hypothetical protein